MKRIICLVLSLTLTTALFSGCNNASRPNVTDGQICTADDLQLLVQNPAGDYVIAADIDLGGAKWNPVEDFSGSLSGVWGGSFCYTISNFVMEASSEDQAVGFFRTLSGRVSDLNFEDVTLILPAEFAGSAGIVAGVADNQTENVDVRSSRIEGGSGAEVGMLFGHANETLNNCYTDGAMALTAAADSTVGGLAGYAMGVYSSESRAEISLNATAGNVDLGGITGSVREMQSVRFGGTIDAAAEGAGKLAVASLSGTASRSVTIGYNNARHFSVTGNAVTGDYIAAGDGAVQDCVTRDPFNLEETVLSDAEYAMRKEVVDYAYRECTVPWSPTKDMHYEDDCSSGHIQNYLAGHWYFGLPYTHKCGSLEKFRNYLDENGCVKDSVPASDWGSLLGNDCADMVYWALARVSASPKYVLTDGMICENGMIPVGQYQVAQDSTGRNSSAASCTLNGEQVLYEAYAQMKMGDVLVKGPGGHARMAAENAYVYRNADGTINAEKSYICTHEQGASMKKLEEIRTTCRVNARQTFAKLFGGAYVPVTIPEYADAAASQYLLSVSLQENTLMSLRRSLIVSNYRINFVRVVITQGETTVYEKAIFPCTGEHNTSIRMSTILTSEDMSGLKSGESYHAAVYVNGDSPAHLAVELDCTA